jgi:hypothetical protein
MQMILKKMNSRVRDSNRPDGIAGKSGHYIVSKQRFARRVHGRKSVEQLSQLFAIPGEGFLRRENVLAQ